MLIRIGQFDVTECWDGVFYKKLSRYPDITTWERQTVLVKQRLDELEAFLDERQGPVTDYDEGMVRRLIERITVFEDQLEFEFKCGLETEVQM